MSLIKDVARYIYYSNASSGLIGDDVQEAIDEIANRISNIGGSVNSYSDLASLTVDAGTIYLVLNDTGSRWLLNFKPRGVYLYTGSSWEKYEQYVKYSMVGSQLESLWQNATTGGASLYPQYTIINDNGILYQNLTGTNTDTAPNLDTTNWKYIAPFTRTVDGYIQPLVDGDNLNLLDAHILNVDYIEFKNSDIPSSIVKISQKNIVTKSALGTTLNYGGVITINALDNTKFDISAGSATFVDEGTSESNPVETTIEWGDQIGVTVTGLNIQPLTFVNVLPNGTFEQIPDVTKFKKEREVCILGVLTHFSQAFIEVAGPYANIGRGIVPTLADLCESLGTRINYRDGNRYVANGANLHLDKEEGFIFGLGINREIDIQNPNIETSSASSQVAFLTFYRNALPFFTDTIDTEYYDPFGDGNLVLIPEGYYVPHRLFRSSETKLDAMQYGQIAYDSLKKAVISVQSEDFETVDSLTGVYNRGALIVKQGATNLNDQNQAMFVHFGILGNNTLVKVPGAEKFAEPVEVVDGLSYQRQALSTVYSGGSAYLDVAEIYDFESNDIYFQASDNSINSPTLDFTNGSIYTGDPLKIKGSISNNGFCKVSSVTANKIIVTSKTIVNESAGNTVILNTAGKGNITYIFGQKEFILNCTTGSGVGGRARIELTLGTDQAPQINWIHIIRSGTEAILNKTLVEPDDEFAMVCHLLVPSYARASARCTYNSRRWSDVKEVNGRGAIANILFKQRNPISHISGGGANITINSGTSPYSIDITVDPAVFREIFKQYSDGLQLSVDGAYVVNDPVEKYKLITNGNQITVDSQGNSLNNKFFRLVFMIALNTACKTQLLITLPNGSYGNALDAFRDSSDLSVTSLPEGFTSAYLICAGVFKIQGGTIITNEALAYGVNNIDLRKVSLGGFSGGSGSAAITEFNDDLFAIFDNLDSSKRAKFQVSNVNPSGTTRTLTIPNNDGIIATTNNILGTTNRITEVLSGDDLILDISSTYDSMLVKITGNQTIGGIKTFTSEIQASLGVNVASGQAYEINGVSINVAGTLSNVAYLNANNTFTGDNTFNGNVFVNGDKIAVDKRISVADNLLALNFGETGAGLTSTFCGVIADRGSTLPFAFGFEETRTSFVLGLYYVELDYTGKTGSFNLNDEIEGDSSGATGYVVSDDGSTLTIKIVDGTFTTETITNNTVTGSATVTTATVINDMQVVLTRQDTPTSNGLLYYNATQMRADTASTLTFDGTTLYTPEINNTGDILMSAGKLLFDKNLDGGSIYFDSANDLFVIEKTDGNGATPDGDIVIRGRGNNDSLTEYMRIKGLTGRIGINESDPATFLEITSSSSNYPYLRFTASSDQDRSWQFKTTDNTDLVLQDLSGSKTFKIQDSGSNFFPFTVRPSSSSGSNLITMLRDSLGSVCIGTPNTATVYSQLYIAMPNVRNILTIEGGGNNDVASLVRLVDSDTNLRGSGVLCDSVEIGSEQSWFIGKPYSSNYFQIGYASQKYSTDEDDATRVAQAKVLIAPVTGYFGIGKTPTTQLDVNGVITATGGNSTNWNTAYTHSQLTSGNPHSVTKSDVGLSNVENTALSTWAGSTNITTLGTIADDLNLAKDLVVSGNIRQAKSFYYDEFWEYNTNLWATLPASGTTSVGLDLTQKGGVLKLSAGGIQNANISIYQNVNHQFNANLAPEFEANVTISDTSFIKARVGLYDSVTGYFIMFECNATTSALGKWVGKTLDGTGEATSSGINASISKVNLRWKFITSSSIEFFVDGASAGTITTHIPVASLDCYMLVQALAPDGSTRTLSADSIKVWQNRT